MAKIIDQVNLLLKDSISSIHGVDNKNIFGSIWYFDTQLHKNDFFPKKNDVISLVKNACLGGTDLWKRLAETITCDWKNETYRTNKRLIVITDGDIPVPATHAGHKVKYHNEKLYNICELAQKLNIQIDLNIFFDLKNKEINQIEKLWKILIRRVPGYDRGFESVINISHFQENLADLKKNLEEVPKKMQKDVFDICTMENMWWIYSFCELDDNNFPKTRFYFYPLLAYCQFSRKYQLKERNTGNFTNYLLNHYMFILDDIEFDNAKTFLKIVKKENSEVIIDDIISFLRSEYFVNNYVEFIIDSFQISKTLIEDKGLLHINENSPIIQNVIKPYFFNNEFINDLTNDKQILVGLMNEEKNEKMIFESITSDKNLKDKFCSHKNTTKPTAKDHHSPNFAN
jgi:hypothetical protein